MIDTRRIWCLVFLGSLLLSSVVSLRWSGTSRFPLRILASKPLSLDGIKHPAAVRTLQAPVSASHDIIQDLKHKIVVLNNATSTLRNLISFGDQWVKLDDTVQTDHKNFVQSELERVQGCTSTVKIKTSYTLLPQSSSAGSRLLRSAGSNAIRVEGTADSRVTQGMLAILCNVRYNSMS